MLLLHNNTLTKFTVYVHSEGMIKFWYLKGDKITKSMKTPGLEC